jgi:hypothetical protein
VVTEVECLETFMAMGIGLEAGIVFQLMPTLKLVEEGGFQLL